MEMKRGGIDLRFYSVGLPLEVILLIVLKPFGAYRTVVSTVTEAMMVAIGILE